MVVGRRLLEEDMDHRQMCLHARLARELSKTLMHAHRSLES